MANTVNRKKNEANVENLLIQAKAIRMKRWVSTLSAVLWLLSLILWLVLWFDNPYSKISPLELITLPGVFMVALCLLGMFVSIRKKPVLMLVVSTISFFPIGWYLLGSPGIFKIIGLSNMACFILSLLMFGSTNKLTSRLNCRN